MVDIRKAPFNLDEQAVSWVEQTVAGMSQHEKICQLFADPLMGKNETELLDFLARYPIAGCGFRGIQWELSEAQRILGCMQESLKIPLLVSADCGSGSSGQLRGGTLVASGAQAGAAPDEGETAYRTAKVACTELGAVGYNWAFEPVGDILINWRNCVINNRAFSSDTERVITCARSYIKGVQEGNFVPCLKHFPGDGWEERDQHLVPGNNGLSCEEWDETFGKVYRTFIEEGVLSIMIGHFTLPSWQRRLNPALRDEDMDTACLSQELIDGLLRQRLGFNGLVLTDQSNMLGFYTRQRSEALVLSINAGCDLILGTNDMEEDYDIVHSAIENGQITQERLHDALARILATKASIGLHKKQAEGHLVPPVEALSVVGCAEHLEIARQAADDAITLVKNSRNQLPIHPRTHPNILVHVLQNERTKSQFAAGVAAAGGAETIEHVKHALEEAGFCVTMWDAEQGRSKGKTREFAKKYDAVFLFADLSEFASINSVRLRWNFPMEAIGPWYVPEVPTVFVSLNYTNHLFDVPRVPIFINAYNNRPETIALAIKKIMGESEFTGNADKIMWCDHWDTRL